MGEVKRMIVGAEGCICDYCVAMCFAIMMNQGEDMMQVLEKVKSELEAD